MAKGKLKIAHGSGNIRGIAQINDGQWYYVVAVLPEGGVVKDVLFYLNGDPLDIDKINDGDYPFITTEGADFNIGRSGNKEDKYFNGLLDEIRIYSRALSLDDIREAMDTSAASMNPLAYNPFPPDGSDYVETMVNLMWLPGAKANSHDVYLGESFEDVNDATQDSDVFQGNQTESFYITGLSGYTYPEGLVPGTTYYWRIDEVNDGNPNSPWKGDVWSFFIAPKKAYNPYPNDGAEFVDLEPSLTWTPGFGAKLHTVFFSDDYETVANAVVEIPSEIGNATYSPGLLKQAKTYYWRVDEFDGSTTHTGKVWSLTTEGAISSPYPVDGAVDVKPSVILSWNAGAVAASHEVYFGMDANAVKNATKTSPQYKGDTVLGEESYDPGKLMLNAAYYWRIDEVNGVNPDSPWIGEVWSFATGDYFDLDDFEHYDANDNQIWYAWYDGFGYGTPETLPYFVGNGTGAAVGNETIFSYTEETIVHSGSQSMPIAYDNDKQGYAYYSEVERTLTNQRDWTEQGIAELSIWFHGNPAYVGSFIEGADGTFTITASGNGIVDTADEFHYTYKMLNGVGSIEAKVLSVGNTHNWAKAGVMIRETLQAGSKFALACITPANAVASQGRDETGGDSFNQAQGGISAPHWVRLERDITGNLTVLHSSDGTTWETVEGAAPMNIAMTSNVYIGLALTAHNSNAICEAVFSNVTTTGTVSGQWISQDIGILSNDTEPLYVAVSNSNGAPVVVVYDDLVAAQISTWTEWIIPLQTFADQGIVLTDVDKVAIGLGTKGNMTVPGGKGKMYIDDIRLYQPTQEPQP